MRILHLIDNFDYCDGCARHVYILSREQRNRGYDVAVVTGGGDAVELLEQNGINVFIVPTIKHAHRSIKNFIAGTWKLSRISKQFQPDIYHAHHFYVANQVRWMPIVHRPKIILTVHADIPCLGILPHHVGKKLIAVSQSVRREILKCSPGIDRRIEVILYGTSFLGFEEEVRALPLYDRLMREKPSHFVITFAGRLVQAKGVHLLIQAIVQLREKIPVLLVIAGMGTEQDSLLQQANDEGIDYIYFGNLRDIKPVLESSDVVIMPSLMLEGFGLILLEAGLTRRAVIASRTDGIPELIEHERTGLLVEPGNVEEIASAIHRLYVDHEFKARLQTALHETVVNEYTIEKMTNAIERVYKSVL